MRITGHDLDCKVGAQIIKDLKVNIHRSCYNEDMVMKVVTSDIERYHRMVNNLKKESIDHK